MTNISSSNAVQVDLSGDKLQQYFLILERYVLPFLVVATIVLLCGYIASRIFNRRQRRIADDGELQAPKATPEEGTAAFLRELTTTPPIRDPETDDALRLDVPRRRNIGQEFREPKFSIGPSGDRAPVLQPDQDEKPLLLQVTAATEDDDRPSDDHEDTERSTRPFVAVGRWDDPTPIEPNVEDSATASDGFLANRSNTDRNDGASPDELPDSSIDDDVPARLSGWDATAPSVTTESGFFGGGEGAVADDAGSGDDLRTGDTDEPETPLTEPRWLDESPAASESPFASNGESNLMISGGPGDNLVDEIDETATDDLLADGHDIDIADEAQTVIEDEALTLTDHVSSDDTAVPVRLTSEDVSRPENADREDLPDHEELDAATVELSSSEADNLSADQWRMGDRDDIARTHSDADDWGSTKAEAAADRDGETEPLERDEPPADDDADIPAMLLREPVVAGEPSDDADHSVSGEADREAPLSELSAYAEEAPEGAVVHPLPGHAESSAGGPTGADWDKAYAALQDLLDDLDHAAVQVQGNIDLVSGFETSKSELNLDDVERLRISGLELLDDLAAELEVLGESVGDDLADGCAMVHDFNRIVGRLEEMAESAPLDEGWNELIMARLSTTHAALERVKKTIAAVVPLDQRRADANSDLDGSDPAVSTAPDRRFPFGRRRG